MIIMDIVVLIIIIILIILRLIIIPIVSLSVGLRYHTVRPSTIKFSLKKFIDIPETTSMDFVGDTIFISSKNGKLYRVNIKTKKQNILLDMKNNSDFTDEHMEEGFMCVRFHPNFKNDLMYLSYTVKGDDKNKTYLIVDEYNNMKKSRELIRLGFSEQYHHGGTLAFDSKGNLYLGTGDGGPQGDPENNSQNLKSYKGKILRLDPPFIIAYGLRNPWKISIDKYDRMFIGDVGFNKVESYYMLDNLYPSMPYNLGWNVFEGSFKRLEGLDFNKTLPPIFEHPYNVQKYGGCAIGGYFVDNIYICGDYFGFIRALSPNSTNSKNSPKNSSTKWTQIGFQQFKDVQIYSFGYNKQTNKIYVQEKKSIYELTY